MNNSKQIIKKYIKLILIITLILTCFHPLSVSADTGQSEPIKPGDVKPIPENTNPDYKPIDVSGMYTENKVIGETEDISNGLTTKDAESDTEHKIGDSLADFKNSDEDINRILTWVKGIINIILGLAIVSGLGGLVYLFINLGIYSGNPQARAGVKQKIMILAIATALSTSLGTAFNIILKYMFNN